MPHTVLITDDDASIHELLKRALKPTGARILEAWDGEEALRHLAETPIDLLCTDVMMPGMDGLALVRTLRETGNKNFPVVVLTSMDESVRDSLARHLDLSHGGRDHFVHKPFSVAEVSQLFQGILSKVQPFDEIKESKALEGDLSTLSFLDIIQLLQTARLTGTLEFSDPPPGGKLHVQGGEVVDAECGAAHGRKAFFRMLAWTKGSFQFIKKSALRVDRTIMIETAALVMGGLACLDEHHKLLQTVPVALSVAMEGETFRARLSDEERELLALIVDHKGNRDAVLDSAPREDLGILRDLKALMDQGIVKAEA